MGSNPFLPTGGKVAYSTQMNFYADLPTVAIERSMRDAEMTIINPPTQAALEKELGGHDAADKWCKELVNRHDKPIGFLGAHPEGFDLGYLIPDNWSPELAKEWLMKFEGEISKQFGQVNWTW
jgi:hypothetical protein